MGTVANTVPFAEFGEAPAISRGGKRLRRLMGTITMSASYATGGDTLSGLPTGVGTLKAVNILNRQDGTRFYDWDGSTSTPKIKGYTAGNAEVSNATDLSAVAARVVELIYEQ